MSPPLRRFASWAVSLGLAALFVGLQWGADDAWRYSWGGGLGVGRTCAVVSATFALAGGILALRSRGFGLRLLALGLTGVVAASPWRGASVLLAAGLAPAEVADRIARAVVAPAAIVLAAALMAAARRSVMRAVVIRALAILAGVQVGAGIWQLGLLNAMGPDGLRRYGLMDPANPIFMVRDGSTVTSAARISGLCSDPNTFSGVVLLTTPFAMVWAASVGRGRGRRAAGWFRSAVMGGSVMAVVASGSRSGMLGMFAMWAFAAWSGRRGRRRDLQPHRFRVTVDDAALLVTAFVISFALVPTAASRYPALVDATDKSIVHRLDVYLAAARSLGSRWVGGLGLYGFGGWHMAFASRPGNDYVYFDAHSTLFHVASSFGLLPTLAIGALAARRTRAWLSSGPRDGATLAAGMAGSIPFIMLQDASCTPEWIVPATFAVAAAMATAAWRSGRPAPVDLRMRVAGLTAFAAGFALVAVGGFRPSERELRASLTGELKGADGEWSAAVVYPDGKTWRFVRMEPGTGPLQMLGPVATPLTKEDDGTDQLAEAGRLLMSGSAPGFLIDPDCPARPAHGFRLMAARHFPRDMAGGVFEWYRAGWSVSGAVVKQGRGAPLCVLVANRATIDRPGVDRPAWRAMGRFGWRAAMLAPYIRGFADATGAGATTAGAAPAVPAR